MENSFSGRQQCISLDSVLLRSEKGSEDFIRTVVNLLESKLIASKKQSADKIGIGQIVVSCFLDHWTDEDDDYDRLKLVIGSILSELTVDKEYSVSCEPEAYSVESPNRESEYIIGNSYHYNITISESFQTTIRHTLGG